MEKRKKGIYEKYIKRLLDIILSLIAIIVLSPLLLILVILINIKLGSPVIFTQKRPGKDEKIFKLYKFRSMTDKRDENGNLLPDDQRLTSFGRKLRSTSLDELPELFNILKGDMSIIGPRPLLVEYLPYYTKEEHERHRVRPGLSGLAQVNGRNASKWDDRLAMDVKYVNNITFIEDVKLVFLTMYKTIKRSDILVGSEIPSGKLYDARSKNGINY
ncbi:MAG: sugar transferase [Peptoniphilaceae bacterium]|nr:sugar transferase [Peptoniphilaceae bacterium]MDY3737897.1 sugar transferase [Peptoniphilaceae bacterium]